MYCNWGVAVRWDRCEDMVDKYVVYRFGAAQTGRYIGLSGSEEHGKISFTWEVARTVAMRAAVDIAIGKMYLSNTVKDGWLQEELDAIEIVRQMIEEDKDGFERTHS